MDGNLNGRRKKKRTGKNKSKCFANANKIRLKIFHTENIPTAMSFEVIWAFFFSF